MSDAGAPPLLRLEIAAKRFPTPDGPAVEVIRDLCLEVRAGEVVALTGPSGCGKTTTLTIAAGLDSGFTGRRTLRARPGGRTPVLASMFQEPRLLPWRTLRQNVELVLPRGTRDSGLGELWLERMGLAEAAHRFPGQVSLGMQRRAALARAMATGPDLLLLDEPLVSLDEPTALRLRRLLLATLEETGCAALLVTHDLREAIALADRLLLLTPGPCRLSADIPVPGHRGGRTEQDVERIRHMLMEQADPAFRRIA